MNLDSSDTAVVVIDPQNDVLSPSGKNWEVLEASVTENDTVRHLIEIFTAAKAGGFTVIISRTTSIRPTTAGCSTARWNPTNCAPTRSRGAEL